MYLPGHLGMALLVVAPLAAVQPRRHWHGLALLVAAMAMLPDVDLLLPGVQHHGVTHTVVFVVTASAVGGLVGVGALRVVRRVTDRRLPGNGRVFRFAAAGVLLGGLSHLLADALTAPDVAKPIHPFWPVARNVVSVDVLPIRSTAVNVGLLVVGLGTVVLADRFRAGSTADGVETG